MLSGTYICARIVYSFLATISILSRGRPRRVGYREETPHTHVHTSWFERTNERLSFSLPCLDSRSSVLDFPSTQPSDRPTDRAARPCALPACLPPKLLRSCCCCRRRREGGTSLGGGAWWWQTGSNWRTLVAASVGGRLPSFLPDRMHPRPASKRPWIGDRACIQGASNFPY